MGNWRSPYGSELSPVQYRCRDFTSDFAPLPSDQKALLANNHLWTKAFWCAKLRVWRALPWKVLLFPREWQSTKLIQNQNVRHVFPQQARQSVWAVITSSSGCMGSQFGVHVVQSSLGKWSFFGTVSDQEVPGPVVAKRRGLCSWVGEVLSVTLHPFQLQGQWLWHLAVDEDHLYLWRLLSPSRRQPWSPLVPKLLVSCRFN